MARRSMSPRLEPGARIEMDHWRNQHATLLFIWKDNELTVAAIDEMIAEAVAGNERG